MQGKIKIKKGETMKFEEAIKIVGEEYVKKEIERMEEDEVTIKLPI